MGINNIGVTTLRSLIQFGGKRSIFMTQASFIFVDGLVIK